MLDQVKSQLAEVETPTDVEGSDSLSRLLWLAELLEAHRSSEDVRGYTPTMLATVQAPFGSNIQANVAQYLSDPEANLTFLRTAADQVDGVLDQMGTWPPLPAKGAAIAAGQAASAFEKSTKAALDTLAKDRDEAIGQVSNLKATVADQAKKLEVALTRFETDSDTALHEALDELVQTHLDRVSDTLVKIKDDEALGGQRVSSLTRMEAEGKQVLESLANRAVAKDYRKAALNKAVAGWVWDLLGLAVGGVPLVILLVHFFQMESENPTTASLTLARIGISLAAVGLATLCFRRGSANHAEGRRAKRADLRLTTVHPFIANEDEDFKRAIVEGMAERIYLHGKLDEDAGLADPSILEKLIERVRRRRETEGGEAEHVPDVAV